MTTISHAAAMALFRLIGAGVEARVHRLGVDLVMPPDFPDSLAAEASQHAVTIGRLLRLRTADEPRRLQGRGDREREM